MEEVFRLELVWVMQVFGLVERIGVGCFVVEVEELVDGTGVRSKEGLEGGLWGCFLVRFWVTLVHWSSSRRSGVSPAASERDADLFLEGGGLPA